MAVRQEKGKKTWLAEVRYETLSGEVRRHKKTGFVTKKEAKEYEHFFLSSKEHDLYSTSDLTVSMLCEKYLQYKSKSMKSTSITTYRRIIENNIIPYIGHIKAEKITTKTVSNFQDELIKNNHTPYSINRATTLLSQIFKYGVNQCGIQNNPVTSIERVKSTKVKKMRFLSYDEYMLLLSVTDDELYYAIFVFLYEGGMRRGELQAIQITDIDLQSKTVSISKTLTQKQSGVNYLMTTPKTKSSIRTILMTERMIQCAKTLIDKHKTYTGYSKDYFLFGGIKPVADETLRRNKDKYQKLANIEPFRIHDFRHSHISFLIDKGVDIVKVAQRVGHSNPTTTLSIYSHTMINYQKDLVNLF